MACVLNLSLPVANYTCAMNGGAYACSCDPTVVCCENEDCPGCYDSESSETFFSFSWPLVAGWYAMLVVLFCFGRRGRVGTSRSRFCFWRRDRGENPRPEDFGDVEFTPVVKTRKISASDLEECPVCTICLSSLEVDDVVANLDCQHLYHNECIVPWLRRKSTCPLCAQHIDVETARHPVPSLGASSTSRAGPPPASSVGSGPAPEPLPPGEVPHLPPPPTPPPASTLDRRL